MKFLIFLLVNRSLVKIDSSVAPAATDYLRTQLSHLRLFVGAPSWLSFRKLFSKKLNCLIYESCREKS
jgi:hypothetical protein